MSSALNKLAFPSGIPVRAALTVEIKVVSNENLSHLDDCAVKANWTGLSLKLGKYFSYSLLFACNGFINLFVDW